MFSLELATWNPIPKARCLETPTLEGLEWSSALTTLQLQCKHLQVSTCVAKRGGKCIRNSMLRKDVIDKTELLVHAAYISA